MDFDHQRRGVSIPPGCLPASPSFSSPFFAHVHQRAFSVFCYLFVPGRCAPCTPSATPFRTTHRVTSLVVATREPFHQAAVTKLH